MDMTDRKRGALARRSLVRSYVNNWDLYLLLIPVLAYFIIFRYWPMAGVQIAFKDFYANRGIWGSPWAGLKHFERFFSGYYFPRLMRNTISLSFLYMLFSFPMPILLAIMLNECRTLRLKKLVQTITYAPHFLSTVVVVGLLITMTSPRNGIINEAIRTFGGQPISFMYEEGWFKPLYIILGVWQETGWNTIIYMAALTAVDPQLYEAAVVDGANRLQRIRHITVPSIMPTMVVLLILNSGKLMNVGHEKVLLMQNDLNIAASDIISTYVYRMGMQQGQYSFSTAVGLFNSVINTILIVAVNTIAHRLGEEGLW